MNWQTPPPATTWKAIEAYLALAYDGPPPTSVRSRLQTLRDAGEEAFYESTVFEADPKDNPTRLNLRLGNRWYPHMKLTIEPAPTGNGYLFRPDTHDRHIHPHPGSRDYEQFRQLMQNNQSLANSIDAAWDTQGLPTFKAYLREDLVRRRTGR